MRKNKDDHWTADTLKDVADCFGIGVQTVNVWRQQGMPGKRRSYVLAEISQWLVSSKGPHRHRTQLDRGSTQPATDDPLLTGDSPALERYRLAKAQHAELDLEHRRGTLIDRERNRDILSRWAVIIRRTGERLAKRHGNDVAVGINDALNECGGLIKSELGNGHTNGRNH